MAKKSKKESGRCLVLITCSSKKEAEKVKDLLLNDRTRTSKF